LLSDFACRARVIFACIPEHQAIAKPQPERETASEGRRPLTTPPLTKRKQLPINATPVIIPIGKNLAGSHFFFTARHLIL
jgi:hypothetical protein